MTAQYELPPLPGGGTDFSVDIPYMGTSPTQDRAIEALHKSNRTLHSAFTAPDAVLPLPPVRFPEGRVYLFAGDVALVVEKVNGRVVASLPTRAALRTLDEHTPEVIEEDDWAAEQWRLMEGTSVETQRRWHKQSFHDVDGARWTIRRTSNGKADVIKDGVLVCTVDNGDEADDQGLETTIAELVDYVVEHP
jgi:hypothetical protein